MSLNVLLPKNAKQIFIPARVGKLDCLVLTPTNIPHSKLDYTNDQRRNLLNVNEECKREVEFNLECGITGVAIVFHPNPLEGGTYTNKVVQTIAKALNNKGYLCYCPNLRGVGMSDGTHDYGVGEIDDALEIYNYIQQNQPNLPLVLAGFSFGTAIASGLAAQVEYKKLILVGPAVTRFKVIVPDKNKTIVIHGQDDEVIDLASVLKWGKDLDLPIICYPNTGHFFHGKLLGLQNLITAFEL